MQKFYVRALLKSGQTNNIANIKTNFKAKFWIPLQLNNKELAHEKHLAFGTRNTLDIIYLYQNISNNDLIININSIDIFYNFKKNNNAF